MLWYTTRLIPVLTNVMEYVHLTSYHSRQRKPPVPMTAYLGHRDGRFSFLIAYTLLILCRVYAKF